MENASLGIQTKAYPKTSELIIKVGDKLAHIFFSIIIVIEYKYLAYDIILFKLLTNIMTL